MFGKCLIWPLIVLDITDATKISESIFKNKPKKKGKFGINQTYDTKWTHKTESSYSLKPC